MRSLLLMMENGRIVDGFLYPRLNKEIPSVARVLLHLSDPKIQQSSETAERNHHPTSEMTAMSLAILNLAV